MLEGLGALRNPARLPVFLALLDADKRGRLKPCSEHALLAMRQHLEAALGAALSVRGEHVMASDLGQRKGPGPWVGEMLVQLRVRAIALARHHRGEEFGHE
jgi:hypothetical protein